MAVKLPWETAMPASQFNFMKQVLAAPSPIGFEAAMTYGVLKPDFDAFKLKKWDTHQFMGNAGLVFDTDPGNENKLKVMICGHADKIRMQVRRIGEDGKIWINTDSFLPTVLIGHEVTLFSRNPKTGKFRGIEGGTVEALGAIHFAPPEFRSGSKGLKSEQIYLELQVYGENGRKQVEDLGVRPGDPIILNRPIKRGVSKDTFYGAYLDNGLGCFVVQEVLRLLATKGDLKNIRVMGAVASYEEIGRFGSRVFAGELKPDVLIAVDVNHDYKAAPGVGHERHTPQTMGEGFTIDHGSIISNQLNEIFQTVSDKKKIPLQDSVVGRDTGTDGMAAVLASIDAAATSVGFPIRNMHTISETAHTGDVLGCIHGIYEVLRLMDSKKMNRETFKNGHINLAK